jgi:glycosyltransferase involved in cell wall biosynthesis
MKILLDHSCPFFLAHGGVQVQIEQTKAALEQIGVEVEYLRWWDDRQEADLIHTIGRPSGHFVQLAHQKGMAVVAAELMGGLSVRPPLSHALHRAGVALARRWLPPLVSHKMGWSAFQTVDAFVSLTAWEAHLLHYVFGVPKERITVIPNGVESVFFESDPAARGEWLVCTSTVRDIKRTLELAEAAILAQTPVWIIGRPYAEDDPYYRAFLDVVRGSNGLVRYEGPVSDRVQLAAIYRQARGFVLLSQYESLSLSALEAAACECPLLLSDLAWARTSFADHARYCPVTPNRKTTAQALRAFYDAAPTLPPPPRPASWRDVALQLSTIYETAVARRKAAAQTA